LKTTGETLKIMGETSTYGVAYVVNLEARVKELEAENGELLGRLLALESIERQKSELEEIVATILSKRIRERRRDRGR